MPLNLKERFKEVQLDITKNSKTIPRLIELKEELNQAFDDQIEELLKKNKLVKKIKIPQIDFKILKYLISAPFIYSMILPAFIFHLAVEMYQQICFRLYGIPLVDHKDYFVYDRQLLDMLNFVEKINCTYCSYFNNLIRYTGEIGGRTERYWCPIKYYRKMGNGHSQYTKFVEAKDSKDIHEKWEELRDFSDLK